MSPIDPVANGWLITCEACLYETFAVRRTAADRVLHDHRKTHNKETS